MDKPIWRARDLYIGVVRFLCRMAFCLFIQLLLLLCILVRHFLTSSRDFTLQLLVVILCYFYSLFTIAYIFKIVFFFFFDITTVPVLLPYSIVSVTLLLLLLPLLL